MTHETHGHVPVMPRQVLDQLAPRPGQCVLDATLGRGGHAALILPLLGPGGCYVGLDLDADNLAYARARLAPLAQRAEVTFHAVHSSFHDARAVLEELNIAAVDGLLADLGFASTQIDDPQRGLSFMADGPLDMRLNRETPTTAADLLARLNERELADVIFRYGEEPLSRRIARKIVERRTESPIQTTADLAQLVRQAYGPRARQSRLHPATRTFMALRIAVNGELEALDRLLDDLPRLLAPMGRAVFISFHSLEDRRVKRTSQALEKQGRAKRLTRKPMTADDAELAANPRSRSAKLRALEMNSHG